LSDSERARCRRFLFEEDRVSFIVAHALLRTALSRYAAASPGEWRFSTSGHGRPEISSSENLLLASLPSPGAHALFFSLWTLKEAYVKARGLGLEMPLDFVFFPMVPPPSGDSASSSMALAPIQRGRDGYVTPNSRAPSGVER
jgi:4'-phosphopantetheinyl transferase